MRKLGVREAADAIRSQFYSDRSARTNPEDAHRMKFAKDVAAALGADTSPESVQHIMILLREADIDLHTGQEYPKYVTRKYDNTSHVVQNEAEAEAKINEEPEPVAPAPRVVDAPVQDLSLDLKNQVPHHVDHNDDTHPAGRVPSAVTNREAAQDAYARQPAPNQDAEAARATYVEHTDSIDGDDDGEVHIEDVAPSGSKAQGGAPYAKPADTGVMVNDDPDGDGIAGQDTNPTHDSVLGTDEPQDRSRR